MQRAFNQCGRAAVAFVAALCLMPGPAAAQRLLDLPVRTWAGADAVAAGAVATFWNPAGAGILARRGEVLLADVLAPEATGVSGFALAGAWRIDARTTVAAGYHHVGIDNILRTGNSPLPQDATPLELGENGLVIAASRQVSGILHGGVLIRYIRASEVVLDRSIVEFGAGVHARPALPLLPVIAAAVRVEDDGLAWMAGVEATPFISADSEWRAGLSWGMEDAPLQMGPSHRLAGLAGWRDYVVISAGVVNEADVERRTWRPVLAGTVRVSRYALSVMREEMPEGFGAIHAVRFSVAF